MRSVVFRIKSLVLAVISAAVAYWEIGCDLTAKADEVSAKPHAGQFAFRLPAQFREEDAIFILHAQIGSEASLNLYLDTGATDLVLSEPVAARLRNAREL